MEENNNNNVNMSNNNEENNNVNVTNNNEVNNNMDFTNSNVGQQNHDANVQSQGNQTANDYDSDANIALILGILSLVLSAVPLANLILAIVAIVKAKKIPKEYRPGKATAGMVMGIITLIIMIIGFVLVIIIALGLGVVIYDAASSEVNKYSSNLVGSSNSGYYANQTYDYFNDISGLYEVTENNTKNIVNSVNSTVENLIQNPAERIFKNKDTNITYTLPPKE